MASRSMAVTFTGPTLKDADVTDLMAAGFLPVLRWRTLKSDRVYTTDEAKNLKSVRVRKKLAAKKKKKETK